MLMRRTCRWLSCVVLLLALDPLPAQARDLFRAGIVVNGVETASRGVNRLSRFSELFDNVTLERIFPDYIREVSSLAAGVDLRGVPAFVGFALDSPELVFRVPGADINLTFDGSSRDDSQELFERWLKGDLTVDGISLTPLLQELVALSPIDPVAGNPNSLQTRMFVADFTNATLAPWTAPAGQEVWINDNPISIRPAISAFDADGFTAGALDIPISYHVNFDDQPFSLILDLPFAFTTVEGEAESYMASFGVGVQYRPTDWWSITPAARAGMVGSIDVGALAALYAGTVTSYVYHAYDNGLRIGWGIMGGVAETFEGIQIDDFDFEYDLSNQVLRNGLDLSGRLGFALFGQPTGFRLFGTDTRFFGDDLFLEQYNEVGLSVGLLTAEEGLAWDWLSLGGSVLFGDDFYGGQAELVFRF